MIRTIEELSLNALPALQTVMLDGWVLRFADGYTRRANSVNPLYPSHQDLGEKLPACEQMYAQHGLPTIFKLTPVAQPTRLDEALAARGYGLDARTAVQTLNLNPWDHAPTAVEVCAMPTEEWFAAYFGWGQIKPHHQPTVTRMLDNLAAIAGYALLRRADQSIACGLGVVQDGWLGLFDIVTAADARRQGFGQQMVMGLLAWGKRTGARAAYLQVMLNNEPALRLYAKLGFRETYQYWYRVRN